MGKLLHREIYLALPQGKMREEPSQIIKSLFEDHNLNHDIGCALRMIHGVS